MGVLSQSRLRRLGFKLAGVGLVIVMLTASSCPPSSLPPATGDIEITILRGVDTAGTLCPITRVNWKINPIAVPPRSDGSTVGTTAIDKWSSHSGGIASTNGGTAQFPIVCRHTETMSARAPGTWSVSGKAVQGNAPACNKVVAPGAAIAATFVFNVGGTAESCM
ncbi:MAG TPA: hypothetical protein VK629_14790 [Steroidobacteraceae bacterium]|nr:hypothetical protein [Steroidobacteraceae bacterium]